MKARMIYRQAVRTALLIVLAMFVVAGIGKFSRASIGNFTKADLAGPWQATLIGNTGCGLVSMKVNFTLNSSGTATNATITTHLSGPATSTCKDGTVTTGQTFMIGTLNSNGSGTAGLSCGVSCGWVFQIQVSPDRGVANLTDVDTLNPFNTPTGTMIHQ
jgi:hypothetical protein